MNSIEIDADGRAAWAQTGVTAGDYTKATGARGLATGLGEEGEHGVRRAYPPATLRRLEQVKRQYDPDNLFHLNLNVTPRKRD